MSKTASYVLEFCRNYFVFHIALSVRGKPPSGAGEWEILLVGGWRNIFYQGVEI